MVECLLETVWGTNRPATGNCLHIICCLDMFWLNLGTNKYAMKSKLNIVLLLMFIISAISCSKDSQSTTPTKTAYLTKAPWKYVNVEVGTNNVFTSLWDSLELCVKDNITTFNTNKTYQEVEGATKCDSGDPDIAASGTWQFNADETLLIMDILSYQVITLNENTLKVQITLGGDTYRATYGH